ncbi:hypothetical protein [Virgibacillus sp. DJP39]|uniref:hypothetical protein n=1 Tax=Virgibacillus sp. DJP39 TaxID=3409790 RepID=UPI003BB798FB
MNKNDKAKSLFRGGFLFFFIFCIFWIIGVMVAEFTLSLWQNGEVDWSNIVSMSIAGVIGVLIALGVKKVLKKDED